MLLICPLAYPGGRRLVQRHRKLSVQRKILLCQLQGGIASISDVDATNWSPHQIANNLPKIALNTKGTSGKSRQLQAYSGDDFTVSRPYQVLTLQCLRFERYQLRRTYTRSA